MKATGIIAEYNPFHNGHKYHIEQTRRLTGADFIIVVMSGNFTQRGTPAIIDKYSRARMAIENGADMVIELPACYACGSAEYFAEGAIALLDSLGIVDSICFGSECGDVSLLRPIAEVFAAEPHDYKETLKAELRNGATYPQARNHALIHCIPSFARNQDIINSPNNILGIEYIKSIINRRSNIEPFTIQRTGSDYHSYRFDDNHFSSSLALRQSLEMQHSLTLIEDQVPASVYRIMQEQYNRTYPIYPKDLSGVLKYKLLLEQPRGYDSFVDVSKDLSDRISNHLYKSYDYEKLCDLLKTKNLTYARVSRLLCHILLNLKKEDLAEYRSNGCVFYARVLGFHDNGKGLMRELKMHSSIPLITRVSSGRELSSEIAQRQFEQDILVSHIYEGVVSDKFNTELKNEYLRQVVSLNR